MRNGIKSLRAWTVTVIALLAASAVRASPATTSYTGALANAEDSAQIVLTLSADSSVTLQTYGFGGGTNAAGTVIAPGGFDPFVGLFSGTGASALFLDGTSDILTNYSPGCPPAGTVTVGSVPGQCGDVDLQFSDLAAGTYTVLLSDGAYLPAAVFETTPGYLGDGFFDLTGGVLETCYDADDCNTDTASWALDITASGASLPPTTVPEPSSAGLAGFGMMLTAAWIWRRRATRILELDDSRRAVREPSSAAGCRPRRGISKGSGDMAHEHLSVEDLLSRQLKPSLRATVEALEGEPQRVRITPWVASAGG